jgi:hypothetical protein
MSQFSKMKHSRTQWKEKAKQRGQGERYERREKGRIKAERDQLTHALNASEKPFKIRKGLKSIA